MSTLTPLSQIQTQPILDCAHYRCSLLRSIPLGNGTRTSSILPVYALHFSDPFRFPAL